MKKEKDAISKEISKYRLIRGLIILALVLVIGIGLMYFYQLFQVEEVIVEGNTHYTIDEIKEYVVNDWISQNSIFLSLKYRKKSITDVPFIERMDVSVIDKNTVKITVYEKALAGYVEFLGNYMYFDKDGIVVESSPKFTPGIPQVTGLKFDHVILHKPLPVEKETIFQDILDMTQLLNKYEISADKIHFDSNYDMTLYFGDVRIDLGDKSNIDEKVMRLPYILPSLEGKSGILHLDDFSENNMDITFEEDIEY